MKDKIFLTQTDTTIGFVSQNREKLDTIKNRPKDKSYIIAIDSFKTLKTFTRVPKIHKKRLRRAKKTSFIIKNQAYRVVLDKHHLLLLNRLTWAYTTSANFSNQSYNQEFAEDKADIIIYPLKEISNPSKLYRLTKNKIKKLR